MSDQIINSTNDLSKNEFESLKFQYENSIKVYLAILSQLATVLTIVLIAFVTLIGFAFNNKNAGIIFLGVVFPVFIYFYMRRNREQQFSMLYTATIIEDMINPNGFDGYMKTYVGYNYGKELTDKFLDVKNGKNFEERLSKLKDLKRPWTTSYKLGIVGLFISALIFLILPIVLSLIFRWTLF